MKINKLNAMQSLFSLAALLIFACQPPKGKKMLLTLRLEEAAPGNQCQIFNSNRHNAPDQTFEFAKGQTEHTFEISLEAPEIISMTYNQFFQKDFYAEPGGELTVTLTKEGSEGELTYTCEGSGAVYMELLDSLAKPEADFIKRHKDKEYRQYSLDWEDFLPESLPKAKKEAEYLDQCLLANGQQVVYSFYTRDTHA